MRWRGDPLAMMEQINALDGGAGSGGTAPGCGLTFGIQTPIDSRAQALACAAQVGNVYINRNQIGTEVGAQPFGGEDLSGPGPKAGGPHYLVRYCAEQTIIGNTTAAGGIRECQIGRGCPGCRRWPTSRCRADIPASCLDPIQRIPARHQNQRFSGPYAVVALVFRADVPHCVCHRRH